MGEQAIAIPGFLYLIAEFENDTAGGWTKIGVTASEEGWRINNLRQGNPRELLFASAFRFATQKEAAAAEYALLMEYHSVASRYRPDWIQLSWIDIDARCAQLGFHKTAIGNLIPK